MCPSPSRPAQLAASLPAWLGCNLAGSFPPLPSMVLLLQTEGKCSSHCQDTEDAPRMPMTNPSSCQGNLQHHAGPQHATSSHPEFPSHRDEEEEGGGKDCRHGNNCRGEGVKGLVMHSLGGPQVG